MQAPKESLDEAIAAHWAGVKDKVDKTAQDPAGLGYVTPTLAAKRSSFVTSDYYRGDAAGQKVLADQFARGMREGAEPYIFTYGHYSADSDVVTYRMGRVHVNVSGLELLQAEDPEALGFAKGQELKRLYQASAEAQTVPAGHFDGPPNEPMGPPKPQMLGQPMSDTGHMKRYGKLPPRRFPVMQTLISTQYLSEVLHELAGQASMCWTQPPKGVFDSDRCLSAVAEALKRLEAVQPVAQCGQCGRKTWDDSRVCGMPQPDGSKCAGLMQPG